MYRDESVGPPLLVCQVGSTKLTHDARNNRVRAV
ncbi:hypothetical protein [Gryllotalpicola protaetiae]